MKFIIACDLEGIHGVVGEPYKTLNETPDYERAVLGAELEIGAVARALYDNGAEKVILWDNHGGGGNLDLARLDLRLVPADAKGNSLRADFARGDKIDGVVYLGYHAREGRPCGVLAHTYNSKMIQYVKLNGKSIGELYVDSRIFANLGIKSIFHAGDDVSVAEMKEYCPHALTVITKYGKGRNSADLRDREDVLREIYEGVSEAVRRLYEPYECLFPDNPNLEVRYTRAELAAEMYEKAKRLGIPVSYGEDTHILHLDIARANQITLFL